MTVIHVLLFLALFMKYTFKLKRFKVYIKLVPLVSKVIISPTTFSGTHLPRTMCTGSYALGAVVVVAVFIVPKIEFSDNSLKNYLILYVKRKE